MITEKPSVKTSPHCSVMYFYATGHSFQQTGAFDFQTDSCMLITAYLHGSLRVVMHPRKISFESQTPSY